MKKIFLLLLMFLVINLVACSSKDTPLLNDEVEYINKSGAQIYSYKYDINNFEDDISISTLNEIDYKNNFTIIVFEKNTSYEFFDKTLVNEVFDSLSTKSNVEVIFIGFDDFNFFKDTNFSNEKDYYPSSGYAEGYYNFGSIDGISTFSTDIDTYGESKVAYAVISVTYRKIQINIGNQ